MAGLVTEALARDEEVTWKKSLASERAVMMEALEKLKPNLAALVDRPSAKRDNRRPKPVQGLRSNCNVSDNVRLP